jgi:hypothetical protein
VRMIDNDKCNYKQETVTDAWIIIALHMRYRVVIYEPIRFGFQSKISMIIFLYRNEKGVIYKYSK